MIYSGFCKGCTNRFPTEQIKARIWRTCSLCFRSTSYTSDEKSKFSMAEVVYFVLQELTLKKT